MSQAPPAAPSGHWQASDGQWYPAENHPDPTKRPGWWFASDGQWYPPATAPTWPRVSSRARAPQYQTQTVPTSASYPPVRAGSKAEAALALGIISIFFDFLYIPGILAIVWGGKERRANGKAHVGFVCGIIGTSLAALLTMLIIVAVAFPSFARSPDSSGAFCNRIKVYAYGGHTFDEPSVGNDLVTHAPTEIKGVVRTVVLLTGLDPYQRQVYLDQHPTEAENPAIFEAWLSQHCGA
jgi:hypothetical protein